MQAQQLLAGPPATPIQQKISGRLTSEDTAQDRLDTRGYIDTARKHGQDVMAVLRTAMTGVSWSPPVRAAASP